MGVVVTKRADAVPGPLPSPTYVSRKPPVPKGKINQMKRSPSLPTILGDVSNENILSPSKENFLSERNQSNNFASGLQGVQEYAPGSPRPLPDLAGSLGPPESLLL